MKRFFGWFLTIGGVFFSLTALTGIVAAFGETFSSRGARIAYVVYLLILLLLAIWGCVQGIRWISASKKETKKSGKKPPVPSLKEHLMTSQFPAMYVNDGEKTHREIYLARLAALGIPREHGEKLFRFECDVVARHGKSDLLDPRFPKQWMFNLKQPLFYPHPMSQESVLKEKYLTVSELAKIVDEAEWHFWNSHEQNLPEGIWAEIVRWRRKGSGMDFAIRYFEMISRETGVSMEELMALNGEQGIHLCRYKWGDRY